MSESKRTALHRQMNSPLRLAVFPSLVPLLETERKEVLIFKTSFLSDARRGTRDERQGARRGLSI